MRTLWTFAHINPRKQALLPMDSGHIQNHLPSPYPAHFIHSQCKFFQNSFHPSSPRHDVYTSTIDTCHLLHLTRLLLLPTSQPTMWPFTAQYTLSSTMASAMEVKLLFYYFHLPLSSSQKSTLLSGKLGFGSRSILAS